METKDRRELIFAELSSTDQTSQPHQTFIGKLSRSITLNKKNTISLQSVRTGGFMNIPPQNQDIEVVKSFEGVIEQVKIKILQTTFRSHQDFLKCMNSSFEGVKVNFSQ